MLLDLRQKLAVLLWFHSKIPSPLVCGLLVEAILNKLLGRLILESIVFQKMNLSDQVFFLHDLNGFAVGDLPLINIVFLTGKVRIVHLIDGVESIQAIAQQE